MTTARKDKNYPVSRNRPVNRYLTESRKTIAHDENLYTLGARSRNNISILSLRESDVNRVELNRSNILGGKKFSKIGNDNSLPDIHSKNPFEKKLNSSVEPYLVTEYRSLESVN